MSRVERKAQYKLRISEALRRKLVKAARSHGISVNAEMVERLTRSFEQDDMAELRVRIEKLEKALIYRRRNETAMDKAARLVEQPPSDTAHPQARRARQGQLARTGCD